jgi:hypothetical protein
MKIVNSMEEERTVVRELAEKVKRSTAFHARADDADKLSKTLDAFATAYGTSSQPTVSPGLAHRVKEQLERCFREDRKLWNPEQQNTLELLGAKEGLTLAHLSRVITDATNRFWFHQCARLERRRSVIVFSEPLFFFSRTLRAYLRFLSVNHDGAVKDNEAQLIKMAKRELTVNLRATGMDGDAAKEVVSALDLVPVHHYVGAGDSYGASMIRRWFRVNKLTPPSRREGSRIVDVDRGVLNCIVLASRRTNPELMYFMGKVPQLSYELTEKGIHTAKGELEDKFGEHGMTLAYAVVTNWVFDDSDTAYTIIAANHTRAVGRIAKFLVSDEIDKLSHKLLKDQRIPSKMQLAFEVPLDVNEQRAIMPRPLGDPIIYD